LLIAIKNQTLSDSVIKAFNPFFKERLREKAIFPTLYICMHIGLFISSKNTFQNGLGFHNTFFGAVEFAQE
jgi:hypothetical protein